MNYSDFFKDYKELYGNDLFYVAILTSYRPNLEVKKRSIFESVNHHSVIKHLIKIGNGENVPSELKNERYLKHEIAMYQVHPDGNMIEMIKKEYE